MYVMTEDNKILNLNHYVEIGIYPIDGKSKLQASYHKSRDHNDDKSYIVLSDDIASFETQEEAEKALEALFEKMRDEITWDVRVFKQRERKDISAGL